jgi:hypothetical protein
MIHAFNHAAMVSSHDVPSHFRASDGFTGATPQQIDGFRRTCSRAEYELGKVVACRPQSDRSSPNDSDA